MPNTQEWPNIAKHSLFLCRFDLIFHLFCFYFQLVDIFRFDDSSLLDPKKRMLHIKYKKIIYYMYICQITELSTAWVLPDELYCALRNLY